jgi:flagellar FliL protein
MAKTKKKTDEDGAKDGGMKKKLMVVILVVAAAAGGYMFTNKKAKAAPVSSAATTTTTVAPPVMTLDALTLNLSDGHYLQVTPALQLSAAGAKAKMGTYSARLTNTCIMTLSEESMAGLSAPGGMSKAQKDLVAAINAIYPDTVTGVYFTQFVMQ